MLAKWIIQHFPAHFTYCEPFAGSGAVFFRKHPSNIEVLNDLNEDVVHFFRVLRDDPEPLLRAIELTPFSRAEYELAYIPCGDPIERARRFYVRCWQSFSGHTGVKSGWRTERNNNRGSSRIASEFRRIDGLEYAIDRLKHALIERSPAVDVIQRFDTPHTLFYVDPPYVLGTRRNKKRYVNEMSDDDHCQLAEVLQRAQGMIVLSGYDSLLYRTLYAEWTAVSKTTTTNGQGRATEWLWINPRAIDRRQPLFSQGGEA